MRNPGGWAVIVSPDAGRASFGHFQCEEIRAGITERDTFTCFHCNAVEHVPVRLGPNDIGFCRHCMKRICQRCCDLPCKTYEQKLEEEERGLRLRLARERALQSYGV